MYDSLTTKELTALQDVLFGAVEEAYFVINAEDGNDAWLECYHPMHSELGELFIEAGQELLSRLENCQDDLTRQARERLASPVTATSATSTMPMSANGCPAASSIA